jgi:hypothetical protein
MTSGGIRTNPSKKVIAGIDFEYEKAGNNSARVYQVQPGVSVRPFSALKVGVTANYTDNYNELQYITAVDYISERRYILGTIDQKTLGLTFRVDVNISPELSIQYYGSPFISKGQYSRFKRVTDPEAGNYFDRYALYIYSQSTEDYVFLDQNDDLVPDQHIGNPDFNFFQFRSNLVAKWEYRLGSFIYLVWSGDRTGFSSPAPMGDSFRLLGKAFPNNIFLIKLNYWFSL